MQFIKYPLRASWDELLKRPTKSMEEIEGKVIPILKDVKQRGDVALKMFAEKLDGVLLDTIAVSEQEILEAVNLVSPVLKEAIQTARRNIEQFHAAQKQHPEILSCCYSVLNYHKKLLSYYIPNRVGIFLVVYLKYFYRMHFYV